MHEHKINTYLNEAVVGQACGKTAYSFHHSPVLYTDLTIVPQIIINLSLPSPHILTLLIPW
jgi:hypothetical protein